jgi:hypothetical protein
MIQGICCCCCRCCCCCLLKLRLTMLTGRH